MPRIKLRIEREFDADVLVVGGGAAASRAAVAAANAGARTIVALKGKLGQSGASNYPGGGSSWQASDGCGGPDDSPEAHYQDIMVAALGTADARLAWIYAHESPERMRELETWGFILRKDPTGQHPHFTGYACFGTQPRAHGMIGEKESGHTGNMIPTLKRQILARGATVHEHTSIIDLLVQDGACVGALALNDDGDFIVYHVGAVILATGGASQMYPLSSTPGEITGDGYAMAFRAGAELVNMEFMQYMVRGIAGRGPNIGGQFWALHPTIRNGLGEDVLPRYLPPGATAEQAMEDRMLHWPFSSRDASRALDIAIATEVREGRTTSRGGVVIDFSDVDIRHVKRPRPDHHPAPAEMTLGDPQIEVTHSAHAINGGIRIDEWGRSTIPGLFAAGETTAGPHGADRLGGGMLSQCNVFGARAGQRAAEYARSVERRGLAHAALDALEGRIAAFGQADRADWFEIRKSLKSLCAEHLQVIRNAPGLERLLTELASLRFGALPEAAVPDTRTLLRVLENDDLLLTAEIMARAALLRDESRGSHYREDNPTQDDAHWAKSIFWRNQNDKPVAVLGKYREDPDAKEQVTWPSETSLG
ncbi:MAG TPA: FAD-binding protein [Chloroflexota bacterium]|nr:FAD-binding protein [Chloroflexota bacterium]